MLRSCRNAELAARTLGPCRGDGRPPARDPHVFIMMRARRVYKMLWQAPADSCRAAHPELLGVKPNGLGPAECSRVTDPVTRVYLLDQRTVVGRPCRQLESCRGSVVVALQSGCSHCIPRLRRLQSAHGRWLHRSRQLRCSERAYVREAKGAMSPSSQRTLEHWHITSTVD